MAPLIVGMGAVSIGATLLACLLRPRSFVSFLLAAYLIAWTEVIAVTFGLSAGRWVERWTLIAAFLAVAASAVVVWVVQGRPSPPSPKAAVRHGLRSAADPLVALPLAVSAAALLYTLVVTLTTAPNDGDPLAYELTRAAFWRQEHGIVNLGAAYDPRLDFSPPTAEVGELVLLTLSGTQRVAGLTQWFAVLMLVLATYGVGRRIGLDRRPALWGAALVPTFPVVITQSWSSFTDLVFSSFAVSAVYFGIGPLGVELLPFAFAVALAFGTKFLGPIFAPLFAVILSLAQPIRRWPHVLAAAAAGGAIASLWYVRNQLEGGDPAGNSGVGLQAHAIAPILTTFHRLSVELFDLSGAAGRDRWAYAAAALVVAGIALAGHASGRLKGTGGMLTAAVLIAVIPYVTAVLGRGWAGAGLNVWEALGRGDLVDQLRGWSPSVVADGAFSWFGPVGALLALGGVPVAVAEFRRRELSRTALVLAAAPIAALSLISITIAYQRYEGRYFISTFALCAAIWGGFALRNRWVGTTLVGIAAVTVMLTLVNSLGKPSGVGLFRGDPGPSVWSMPRWEQQGILRPTPPERDEVMTIRFVEQRVPDDASLGIALANNSFAFPYFGYDLGRKLTIVDEGDVIPSEIEWLVASPGRQLVGCADAWRRERLGAYGWSAWRRTGSDTCSAIEPLGAS